MATVELRWGDRERLRRWRRLLHRLRWWWWYRWCCHGLYLFSSSFFGHTAAWTAYCPFPFRRWHIFISGRGRFLRNTNQKTNIRKVIKSTPMKKNYTNKPNLRNRNSKRAHFHHRPVERERNSLVCTHSTPPSYAETRKYRAWLLTARANHRSHHLFDAGISLGWPIDPIHRVGWRYFPFEPFYHKKNFKTYLVATSVKLRCVLYWICCVLLCCVVARAFSHQMSNHMLNMYTNWMHFDVMMQRKKRKSQNKQKKNPTEFTLPLNPNTDCKRLENGVQRQTCVLKKLPKE